MLVHPVDLLLQLCSFSSGYPRLLRMQIFRQRGQYRSSVEQFVLHAPQNRREFIQCRRLAGQLQCRFARQTDKAVQLINRPVRLDPQIVLQQSLAADQTGFACIASPRVDAVDGEPRLVESVGCRSYRVLFDYLARARFHFSPTTTFISGAGNP